MKLLLLLITWIAIILPCATQTPDSTMEERILGALSQLNYDSLVTGIHIDRVPQYLPVEIINGVEYSDSIEMSWEALTMLYGMLAFCQVDSIYFPLLDSAFTEAWQSLEDLDTTFIGGLWMRYDRFKPLYNVGLKWVTEPSTIFSC